MVATSHDQGKEVQYIKDKWVETGKESICPICKNETVKVNVKIAADLSHTGKAYFKNAVIDACIAPLVKALQEGGIDMRGSCCGHGSDDGLIILQDGRKLVIKNE